MAIATDLNNIKALEQGLAENKVSRFAYTQTAYDNNSVAGVTDYVPERDMNVPQGTASAMKVNQTVIDKGWRAQASAITRMLMNHFLGRISYNLNKAHDNFLSLVTSLQGSLGTANGIATLNSNGLLDSAQYPVKVNDISPDASAQITLRADDIDTHSVEVPDISNFGKVWTQSNQTSSNFHTVYYANGIWVAGNSVGTGLWWSSDGKTWTQSNKTNDGFYTVYYANGIWVAGSDMSGLWWSNDGKTWTQSNRTYGFFYTVYCANGIWVAGSYSDTGLWWSNDGKTWTQSDKTDDSFFTVYYANGIWVVGSSSNTGLWWSNDGKTWTQSDKNNDSFYRVYHADGIWVAGSNSNTGLWWSNDGKTWAQSNRTSGNFASAYHANGIWVAGSSSVGLWYSESSGMTKDVEKILMYLMLKVG